MSGYEQNVSKHIRPNKLTCRQCGTCAGMCPTGAIEMERDVNGNYFPLINDTLCTDCNICIESCPGFSIDFKLLNMSIFNKSPDDKLLGNYIGCYLGYTTDNEVLKNASSGGIISSLLIYALEKGVIDGAVVTKLSRENPLKPEIIIARSKEEILSAAQSKYIPVPLNIAIREILHNDGKFAIVGLPCHIHGMRKAENLNPPLKEKVVLHIGMICGHTDNLQATYLHLRRKGIPIEELKRIEYRAGNWPGEVRATLKNGTIRSENYRASDFKHLHTCGFFMPLCCTLCSDATNELADISVGDAWLPEFEKLEHGISEVLSRTRQGDGMLQDAARDGKIRLMNLDAVKIKRSQLYQLAFKKKTIVARMSSQRLIGRDITTINTNFLKPTPVIDHLGAFFLYSSIYVASKRFSREVLAHIPSFLLSAYSKMTKPLTGMPPLSLYLHLRRCKQRRNKVITILGSYHGRNAGDDAILASIVSEFKKRSPNIEFNVLSGRPWLLEGKFDVKPISTRPSHLSLNMLGLPAFRSIYRSDLVIITQAIIFDTKLFNPAFNYLFALYLLVPFAKMLEKPVVCYNIGVGPLNTKLGKFLARNILNRVDLIILRQEDSQELLKELDVTRPQISLGADPALNNVPVEPVKSMDILQELGVNGSIIGVNVHGYIDKLIRESKDQISELEFTNIMSKSCDEIIEKLGVNVVFVITNFGYDEKITKQIRDKVRHKSKTAILNNREYTHDEIMGVLGEMEMFIGMRLHSIILAAAMYTPVVGIVYLPKVRDFMRRVGQADKSIEFDEFNVEMLLTKVEKIWYTRKTIREQLKKEISELKKKVGLSTELTLKYLQHQ